MEAGVFEQRKPGDPRELIVAVYSPGPNWETGTAAEQSLAAHRAYQHKQHAAGKLVMGGPFLDRECGMALFQLGYLSEARTLVDADPSVAKGVYNVELYHWRVALGTPGVWPKEGAR